MTRFSAHVDSITETQLQADLLAATVARIPTIADVPALISNDGFTATLVRSADPTPPFNSVRYNFEVNNTGFLPRAGDLVDVAAGTEPASVAVGYAADNAATTTVREDRNGASQQRIAVSSSVKAPNWQRLDAHTA